MTEAEDMYSLSVVSDSQVAHTPAARVDIVEALLNPRDEFGNPLPPLIDRETAMRLLELP